MHFKTFISKIHFKIAPSKNTFQNFYLKNSLQNCSLKNVSQNCYLSRKVIEGTRTVSFFTNFKKKKNTKPTLNKPKTF